MSTSFKQRVKKQQAIKDTSLEVTDGYEDQPEVDGELKLLNISDIYSVKQLRESFDDDAIDRLMNSILEDGQIQPIVVSKQDGKGYQIQKGELRYRAAKRSDGKITHLMAIVRNSGTLAQQFSENFVRDDFTPFEIGKGLLAVKEEKGWDNTQLAKHYNMSNAKISSYIKCVECSQEVVDGYFSDKYSDVDTINLLRGCFQLDKAATVEFLESNSIISRKEAQSFKKSLSAKSEPEATNTGKSNLESENSSTRKDSTLGEPDSLIVSSDTVDAQDTIETLNSIESDSLNSVASVEFKKNRIRVSVDGELGVLDQLASAQDGYLVVILDGAKGTLTLPAGEIILLGYAE